VTVHNYVVARLAVYCCHGRVSWLVKEFIKIWFVRCVWSLGRCKVRDIQGCSSQVSWRLSVEFNGVKSRNYKNVKGRTLVRVLPEILKMVCSVSWPAILENTGENFYVNAELHFDKRSLVQNGPLCFCATWTRG